VRRNLFWRGDEQWRRIEPYLSRDVRGKDRVDDLRTGQPLITKTADGQDISESVDTMKIVVFEAEEREGAVFAIPGTNSGDAIVRRETGGK
jgi:hypothetical protein